MKRKVKKKKKKGKKREKDGKIIFNTYLIDMKEYSDLYAYVLFKIY